MPQRPRHGESLAIASARGGHLMTRGGGAAPPGAAGGLTEARAHAAIPEQLLQGGEIVILLIKPSVWFIVLSCLGFLAGVLVAAVAVLGLMRIVDLHMASSDVIVIAGFIGAVRLLWQLLEWLSRVYVLTDRRVIRVKGVLRVQVFETQLKNIQHTDTLFTIRERLFGLGSIMFSTAGTAVPEATWRMIGRPLDVHQKVVATLNRYR